LHPPRTKHPALISFYILPNTPAPHRRPGATRNPNIDCTRAGKELVMEGRPLQVCRMRPGNATQKGPLSNHNTIFVMNYLHPLAPMHWPVTLLATPHVRAY
jgi:hypothetical protein